MLVPYWAIYEILKELLSHGGNPPGADGEAVIRWGWTAFGGLVGGLVLLYAALMSSHVASFRILYGLRVRLSEHIGKLLCPFPHKIGELQEQAEHHDVQEKMSASAVQYVRGMPVVKIFGQSVRSFRQFNAEIQAYKIFALKCCDTYQNGRCSFYEGGL